MGFQECPSPFHGLRVWRADAADYSFVISHESLKGFDQYSGYTARWKNKKFDTTPFGSQPANRIDGGPWQRWVDVEEACKATLKKLTQQT